MSKKGSPTAGLAEIGRRVFTGPQYSLVAYTNAQDTLDDTTVLGTLVQPTQTNGYQPILLDGTWSFNGGIATYVHSNGSSNDGLGNPCWVATGAWSGVVQGVAMVYGSIVQHYVDLVDSLGNPTSFTASAGAKFAVDLSDLLA